MGSEMGIRDRIHTVSAAGIIYKGTVLIKDGRIQQVIEGTDVPSGYRTIDAEGKVITPGSIGAATSFGLVEVSSSAGTVDAQAEPHAISSAVSYTRMPLPTINAM